MLDASTVFAAVGRRMVRRGESVVTGWIAIVLFGTGLILPVLPLVAPGRLVVSQETIEGGPSGKASDT